ncbi:protein-glutamate methylesterase/protein-glutamine glutaminase [Ideonella livida]|uniref:Protein-glutamate methylesterase/protein-glutamine glutaminase n=1 Tax=Ideonella livida TaxID=2707176 RepID=A0A7C9PHL0_9BURK|nr:chemotaxis response regulator protein-glutamate methylesterase [Ideonella livida]NDY91451.1 chemotaxis response regulator protein-glutamate methylesterase [Ideonella livida]
MAAIKAMIIDDSAVVRKFLADLLTAGGIEVVGTAPDPLFAWPKLASLQPDVIVLDVEMPRMDGISFLRKLMAERPTPVVMCSTLTEAGCETTLQAMAAGAVAFVTKPRQGLKNFLEDRSNGLVETVKAAARANLRALPALAALAGAPPVARVGMPLVNPASPLPPNGGQAMAETTDRVIAIGVSTGGVQSLEVVLRALPRHQVPGIMIVQHMPERFTASFAERLNKLCELEILEARDGDRLIHGRVLIAPGGKHMRLKRSGAQYHAEVIDGPVINHHRPSVDVLFKSVAQQAGRNAIGVIMTGMGDDGARGLRDMHEAGAVTAAQDEASCVVFGMPKEAIRLGGADDVVPLGDIARWLVHQSSLRPGMRAARST